MEINKALTTTATTNAPASPPQPTEILELSSDSASSANETLNQTAPTTSLLHAAAITASARNSVDTTDLCALPSTSAAAASSSKTLATHSSNEQADAEAADSTPLECPICLQVCCHPARLPCGHIFCFLCIKGVAYKNRRCAMCRREIPSEFLDHPQLVNGIEDICTTKTTDDGYQWFYEGRNGGWWQYDERSTIEIESLYKMHANAAEKDEQGNAIIDLDASGSKFDVLICGCLYVIDFGEMIQHPKHNDRRRRKIKRCQAAQLPAKGVAGLSKRMRFC